MDPFRDLSWQRQSINISGNLGGGVNLPSAQGLTRILPLLDPSLTLLIYIDSVGRDIRLGMRSVDGGDVVVRGRTHLLVAVYLHENQGKAGFLWQRAQL